MGDFDGDFDLKLNENKKKNQFKNSSFLCPSLHFMDEHHHPYLLLNVHVWVYNLINIISE
jgi:hypothetical protein